MFNDLWTMNEHGVDGRVFIGDEILKNRSPKLNHGQWIKYVTIFYKRRISFNFNRRKNKVGLAYLGKSTYQIMNYCQSPN